MEQAFRRVCVSADLLHGPGNQRYLQARDYRLLTKGKDAREKADKEGTSMSVLQAMDAPTVWCQEAALAVTYEQSSRMVEPSLELAACKPMSVLMVRALCRELVKCMGTARDGGLGVAAPPGHVTANTCVTVITV